MTFLLPIFQPEIYMYMNIHGKYVQCTCVWMLRCVVCAVRVRAHLQDVSRHVAPAAVAARVSEVRSAWLRGRDIK